MHNPLVEFFGSYGPQPSSNNLYDEFVQTAAAKTGCRPIEIAQPLVEELAAELLSPAPRSIILTGTAGDGKTYTARKLLERLAGAGRSWDNTQKQFQITLPNGRPVVFIKDLSELNEADKTEIYPEVRAALLEGSGSLFVICVNDGHLLKFFRDREAEGGLLHSRIATLLRDDLRETPGGAFQLINMSRQSHATILDSIVDALVDHSDWSACHGCPSLTEEAGRCPIWCNLDVLRQTGGASMRARLKDIVQMASADGQHLSIRQLILLCVNILLGDQKGQGKFLLTCQRARNRAAKGDYAATNPYANAFDDNLGPKERRQYGAFAVLAEFGIGFETNNFFDHGLLWGGGGLPEGAWYGDRIFAACRSAYQKDPVSTMAGFRAQMTDQRRRIFFSIDPQAPDVTADARRDPWNLSVFQHGSGYARLVAALRAGQNAPKDIRQALFRGLNRMMTGDLTSTDDRLWLTEPSGVYLGQNVPLLIAHAGRPGREPVQAICPPMSDNGRPPVLRLQMQSQPGLAVDLTLRPTLFECLMRVAEGALPASFSAECRQDIERFQLSAAAAIRRARRPEQVVPEEIKLDGGALQQKPIEAMASEEDW
jgi:hypothetical protein